VIGEFNVADKDTAPTSQSTPSTAASFAAEVAKANEASAATSAQAEPTTTPPSATSADSPSPADAPAAAGAVPEAPDSDQTPQSDIDIVDGAPLAGPSAAENPPVGNRYRVLTNVSHQGAQQLADTLNDQNRQGYELRCVVKCHDGVIAIVDRGY
jgi:hypothetical protein